MAFLLIPSCQLVVLLTVFLIDNSTTLAIKGVLNEASQDRSSHFVSTFWSDDHISTKMWLLIITAGIIPFLLILLAICCCCNLRSQICLLKKLTPRVQLKEGNGMKYIEFESYPQNCCTRCFYTFSHEIKDYKIQIHGIDEAPAYCGKRNLDQLYYQKTPFRFIKLPNDEYIVRLEQHEEVSGHTYEQRGLTEEEFNELGNLPEIKASVQADVKFNGCSALACCGENSWDSEPAELMLYTTCCICKGQSAILEKLKPKISITDDQSKLQWYSELDTSMIRCASTCEIELHGYTMTVDKGDSVNVTNTYELRELYEQYPFYCIKFNDGVKDRFIVREDENSFRTVNNCANLSKYHLKVGKVCASVIARKHGNSFNYTSPPANLEIYTYPCSICTNTGSVLEELKPNVYVDSNNDQLVFHTTDTKLYKCRGCEVFVNDYKVNVDTMAQFRLSKRKPTLSLNDLYKIFPFFCIKLPNKMFVVKRGGKARVVGKEASSSEYDIASSPPDDFHDYPHGAIATCDVTTGLDLKCKQSFTSFACDSVPVKLVLYSESSKDPREKTVKVLAKKDQSQ